MCATEGEAYADKLRQRACVLMSGCLRECPSGSFGDDASDAAGEGYPKYMGRRLRRRGIEGEEARERW